MQILINTVYDYLPRLRPTGFLQSHVIFTTRLHSVHCTETLSARAKRQKFNVWLVVSQTLSIITVTVRPARDDNAQIGDA